MSGNSVLTERRIIFNAVTLKTAVYVAVALSMTMAILILIFSAGHVSPYIHAVNSAQVLVCIGVIGGVKCGSEFLLALYAAVACVVWYINQHFTLPAIVGTNQVWVHLGKNISANGTLQEWEWDSVNRANTDIHHRVRHYSLLLALILNSHFVVVVACWWIVWFAAFKMGKLEINDSNTVMITTIDHLTRLSKQLGKRIGGPYSYILSEKRVLYNVIPLLLVLSIFVGLEMLGSAVLALDMLYLGWIVSAYSELFQVTICASVFYGVRKGRASVLGIYLVFNLYEAVYTQFKGMLPYQRYWIVPKDALLDDPNAKVEEAIRRYFHAFAALETCYLIVTGAAWILVFLTYKTMKTTPLPNYQPQINAVFMSDGLESGPINGQAYASSGAGVVGGQENRPASTSSSDESTTAVEGISDTAFEFGTSSKAKLVDAMVV